MLKTKFAKLGAFAVGMTFAFGVVAPSAGAQTIAELQAQINALMAQLAALQGGSTPTVSANFTANLTVGSTGAEVTALQQMLVAQGHLTMPVGVAHGYFGPLTRAAVASWQAANGITPAVGYFGPISRAKANTGVVVTPGTPTTPGNITTPGVEGTLTASLASTPTGVKLYEGESRKAVMGIELEAKLSDIRVERVKIDLGTTTDLYRKIADRMYVMDGSTVLATVDLDANTVVKEGSSYYITVTGVNYVVPKDAKRVLTVALDAMNTWDSDFNGDSWTLEVEENGVRGVDGAGINLYNSTAFSRSFTSEAELIAGANLKVSLNANSPKVSSIVASDGVDNDEQDGVELLRFDVRAEKDSVEIIDLDATITRTGGSAGATTTTVYLMEGSTVLDSVNGTALSATGGTVSFDDIDYVIPMDSTRTLRIVVDIRDADTTAATYRASVSSGAAIVAENSVGDTIADNLKTGSATSEILTVRSAGLEVSLVSKSNLTYTPPAPIAGATSSASTSFTLRLTASGSDIYVGPQASSTFVFQTYQNGTATTKLVASSTSWSIPSGVNTSDSAVTSGGFLLTDGQSVEIPVDFFFQSRIADGTPIDPANYAVGLESVKWSTDGTAESTSTFMAGETSWRTNSVVMP
ncbi:MAG: peptidoglycan-binding domain-containing protein [Parcubacteria group bacterium]